MKDMMLIARTIFHLILLVCCFMIISVLSGVIEFSDIWYPLQNFFRA